MRRVVLQGNLRVAGGKLSEVALQMGKLGIRN